MIALVLILIIVALQVVFGPTFGTIAVSGYLLMIIAMLMCNHLYKKYERIVYKRLSQLIKLGITIILISFIIIESIVISGGRTEWPKDKLDYIVVLGSGLDGDRITLTLEKRLEKALEVIDEQDCPIIVSGGMGSNEFMSEAEAMHGYLVEHGVSSERIILEDQSTSTSENLKFTKMIIGKDFKGKVLVISNEFHIFRIKLLAKKENFEISTLGAKVPLTLKLNYLIREYFAVPKSIVFD